MNPLPISFFFIWRFPSLPYRLTLNASRFFSSHSSFPLIFPFPSAPTPLRHLPDDCSFFPPFFPPFCWMTLPSRFLSYFFANCVLYTVFFFSVSLFVLCISLREMDGRIGLMFMISLKFICFDIFLSIFCFFSGC